MWYQDVQTEQLQYPTILHAVKNDRENEPNKFSALLNTQHLTQIKDINII